MLREGAAKLETLLQAQRGALRVVVPLRTGKVTAKSPGGDMPLEGVSVAEVTERIMSEMVGRDGIEPPTPGFSILAPTSPNYTEMLTLPRNPVAVAAPLSLAGWVSWHDRHGTLMVRFGEIW